MQEGVASEASAFAGHFGLDNLILIYDSNAVTLDAPGPATQSEETAARFKAYGFDVQEINGEDMQQFLDALNNAKENNNGKPKFIVAHTAQSTSAAEAVNPQRPEPQPSDEGIRYK